MRQNPHERPRRPTSRPCWRRGDWTSTVSRSRIRLRSTVRHGGGPHSARVRQNRPYRSTVADGGGITPRARYRTAGRRRCAGRRPRQRRAATGSRRATISLVRHPANTSSTVFMVSIAVTLIRPTMLMLGSCVHNSARELPDESRGAQDCACQRRNTAGTPTDCSGYAATVPCSGQ
jgi:hypothetical protein